jgi:hypothetical protein
MRRGNPRRAALEHGILMALTSSMVVGLGIMIYAKKSNGGLPRLDLDAPVDFKSAFGEINQLARGDLSSLKNLNNGRTNPNKKSDSQEK